jgi:hypothetical protein
MSGQIQEGINLRDRHPFRTICNFHDFIVRTNLSFLQHAEVKAWPSMRYEQGWHARVVHANADAVARHAWLRNFKHRTADAVSVADAYFVIEKSLYGEVFSELTKTKVVSAEKALPVVIGVHLVDEYCALLSTVTFEIALRVAVNVQLSHHSPLRNWSLPDRGSNGFAVPRHVAWNPDIY